MFRNPFYCPFLLPLKHRNKKYINVFYKTLLSKSGNVLRFKKAFISHIPWHLYNRVLINNVDITRI